MWNWGIMGRDIELAEQARSNHRAGEAGLYARAETYVFVRVEA